MIFVSNWPALPTKGSPARSSSAPGASPTNINSASGLPTPKTTWVRELTNFGQSAQGSTAARIAARRSAFEPEPGARVVARAKGAALLGHRGEAFGAEAGDSFATGAGVAAPVTSANIAARFLPADGRGG